MCLSSSLLVIRASGREDLGRGSSEPASIAPAHPRTASGFREGAPTSHALRPRRGAVEPASTASEKGAPTSHTVPTRVDMKFARTLATECVQEWAAKYVGYKQLKKLLKALRAAGVELRPARL